MQHLNKIPVPESVLKLNKNSKCGSFGRRVINPLLNDKKGLLVNYMREVNMIDESEEFVKPSKYKFNLVSKWTTLN